MLYYKGMQFVPMKGMAAMYYETDEEANVKRFMTVLEGVEEIERMEHPPMKKRETLMGGVWDLVFPPPRWQAENRVTASRAAVGGAAMNHRRSTRSSMRYQ
jgi:hypothetical protein